MENASKALIIAAEILVGVLLLSLIASLFYIFAGYRSEIQDNENLKQVYSFNTQFEKYKETILAPQDVLTICNLVEDYNDNFETEQIKLTVDGGVSSIKNDSDFLNMNIKYKINSMGYNDEGKVSSITIKKVN